MNNEFPDTDTARCIKDLDARRDGLPPLRMSYSRVDWFLIGFMSASILWLVLMLVQAAMMFC